MEQKVNIARTTSNIIRSLYDSGDVNKAVLASLRNSNSLLNKKAENVIPVLIQELPKEALSKDGTPTKEENAIFTALRCYAIYQQGNDNCVQRSLQKDGGNRICEALANLRKDSDLQVALDRRMSILLASTTFSSVSNSIVRLIQILKSHDRNQLIDFADLAQDLFIFQFNNENARKICLKWGEQYYWDSVNTGAKKDKR